MKYIASLILFFSALFVNGQNYKTLNRLSYNSTVKPAQAIIYGDFIQRLGFSSGGYSQEIRIINLETEELYSFTVKPAFKSAKENTFFYFIKPGNYAILHYWWTQSKWYGGKIFTEPIYMSIASTSDLDEKIKSGQVSRDELKRFTFSVKENSLTYLGTWHFDKEVVSFTNEKLETDIPLSNRFKKLNFSQSITELPH